VFDLPARAVAALDERKRPPAETVERARTDAREQ
jgi:hypothetical protein